MASCSRRAYSSFANISARERRQFRAEVRRGMSSIRALMILLSASGYPAISIADLVGYEPRTVRRWINRFGCEGLDGLPDRPRSSRPRGKGRVTARLTTLLAQPRAWTIPRLARARRWRASRSTLRRRLHEVAQWRRPRLVAKGDPEAPGRWAKVSRALHRLPKDAVILAEDESLLDLLPWVRANSAAFVHLLEGLLQTYPNAPAIAVVLDNVIIHLSQVVRAWLTDHPQVQLLYGARYCPHETPVERIWGAMKRHLANFSPPTIQGRVSQATNFFAACTPEQMLCTAAPWKARWLPTHYGQGLWKAA